MVKLVDTPASGAGDRKVVEVRVFFWAPIQIQGNDLEFHKNPRKRVFAFLTFKNPDASSVGARLARDGALKIAIASKLCSYKLGIRPQGALEKQYRLSLLQVFAMRQ